MSGSGSSMARAGNGDSSVQVANSGSCSVQAANNNIGMGGSDSSMAGADNGGSDSSASGTPYHATGPRQPASRPLLGPAFDASHQRHRCTSHRPSTHGN
jgi:hypothetical protein